jgi:hypothetical protein
MKRGMQQALASLEEKLASNTLTRGMDVRVHGDHLILGRPTDEQGRDDRVRLTRINASTWGLSVKRHTGRWERTPFSGSMQEMVEVIWSLMQHLVASY